VTFVFKARPTEIDMASCSRSSLSSSHSSRPLLFRQPYLGLPVTFPHRGTPYVVRNPRRWRHRWGPVCALAIALAVLRVRYGDRKARRHRSRASPRRRHTHVVLGGAGRCRDPGLTLVAPKCGPVSTSAPDPNSLADRRTGRAGLPFYFRPRGGRPVRFGATGRIDEASGNFFGLDPATIPRARVDIVVPPSHPGTGPFLLTLRAKTVIHAFYVPELGSSRTPFPASYPPALSPPRITGKHEILVRQLWGTGALTTCARMSSDVPTALTMAGRQRRPNNDATQLIHHAPPQADFSEPTSSVSHKVIGEQYLDWRWWRLHGEVLSW